MRHRTSVIACVLIAMIGLLLPPMSAAARPSRAGVVGDDTIHVPPDYGRGQLSLAPGVRRQARRIAARLEAAQTQRQPRLGDVRLWLAADYVRGQIYVKRYRLRGIGQNIEVWVANDEDRVSKWVRFQPGDCRNGVRTRITDAQVQYLVNEFDTNMYPEESAAFSVPPARTGANAQLDDILQLPADYYSGDGDNVVALIDNIRDRNFYDYNNEHGYGYTGGFFSGIFNELVDRNVMTIDAFDWIHRTGATPPDNPVPGDFCRSAPARPFLYEGVFAHEYEHLLMYYQDPEELLWINEGLADWAQTLTGYVDPSVPITDPDFDSHIQCFLGHFNKRTRANPNPGSGGPENSLNIWGDQGEDEILCDYGAAYTMMEFLQGRYGTPFMTALHRNEAEGLEGLQAVLDTAGGGAQARDVIHRWLAMNALDEVLDSGAPLTGGNEADYSTPTLDAHIAWGTKHAYSSRGAPPNGADFVRLRDAQGNFLSAGEVNEIGFAGRAELPPVPVRWRVDKTPPQHGRDDALYSGSGGNLDRAIIRRVKVPARKPVLRFETKWKLEPRWDFGFVQVSTDKGRTWRSLGNRDTTTVTEPQAIAEVKENVPGFTANSRGWRKERFSLRRYAGQSILLSFRLITDPNVNLPGWWVDRVQVGNRLLSRGFTTRGWRSATQVNPIEVEGYTVQLVSYARDASEAHIASLSLDAGFTGTLTGADVAAAIGDQADVVAALVTYDESTEIINQYAPYRLTVNGVRQPGG